MLSKKSIKLINEQLKVWTLPAKNYKELEKVQVKKFEFDQFSINVQFNPARIVSSAAKVDKEAIKARKCFLCKENRPLEQIEMEKDDFYILINPFPIFPKHLTIAHKLHVPQLIKDNFESMLDISVQLSEFVIYYNGPECGASAPDHFHFQAGNNGFLNLDNDFKTLKASKGKKIGKTDEVLGIDDGFRKFIAIESSKKDFIMTVFSKIYEILEKQNKLKIEPALNILSNFKNGKWMVKIFPRDKHRPWQYFEEGDNNILISPASVDLGGILITPLEKDFSKITEDDIKSIFEQVVIKESNFNELLSELQYII